MKLLKLRLRNFRCYEKEISVDFSDITGFVGRNDSGKSSLMDALDIFLNDGVPDKDDASKDGDPKDLTIICEFSEFPSSLVIDDASSTSLAEEFLLNRDHHLEIHKHYSGHLQKPKCESIEAFAVHPSAEGCNDLLQLKNPELKNRAKQIGADLKEVDQKINAQVRAAIYRKICDLDLEPRAIPLNEDNAKKIWTELKKYLPSFALFKSDRASTDQDSEAQDPLKAAVKEAIKAKQTELTAISNYVRDEVQKIASSTLTKLQEMDPSLASELHPTFAPPKWDSLFKASITADEDIPINKRGSGVKRLILLNFFRAKAEQLVKECKYSSVIYGIEEPETSQHPNNQRMLLRALTELSSESQAIITTHTPMLARSLPDTSLRYVEVKADGKREIKVGGTNTNQLFVQSLGVLPDNSVKLFIGVEGPNDITFLQTLAKSLINDGVVVPDLEKLELNGEVIFFPLGGSTLALWISRLRSLNRPEFHLYDRDSEPDESPRYQEYAERVNAQDGCTARITTKREIENYIQKDAIIEAYDEHSISIKIPKQFDPWADVPTEVAKLVHSASESKVPWEQLLDDTKKKKESKVKRTICSLGAKYMNKDRLKEIDPTDEVLGWYREISSMLET